MSRSAADATRFTATGPYATSKASSYKLPGFMAPQNQGGSGNGSGNGGKPETPKEKVERLRAQARAARMARSSNGVDAMIDVGRRFANKAHKAMVYTLIAASGICGALTVYSMVSLTLYNRRQRALWIEKELRTLQDAKTAYAGGTATTEQLELLKNERIGEIYEQKKEEEKAQRPWSKMKTYVFGGLKTDEVQPETADKPGVLEALNAKVAEEKAVRPSPVQPGQLDKLAENVEDAAKQTGRSWTSWFTGR
ncbi:cytochrome oxidase c assembly-domain-containing protein [Aspergillus avenaceus]|uniref:Cytochrome oxidase c assembly-domain-containing protein n=1 Tax=Aspergillus avenaceus TaxID=36643 RepID=A0A5N6U9E6_ASPAV|nr:cytochrome oxidase c assembly-domain-containing protein [Aspergillus avenaceus]